MKVKIHARKGPDHPHYANSHQPLSRLRVAESQHQQKRARALLIRQDGVPPGSSASQEDRFLLRKDGTWVLNITAFTLSEKEQEQQFIFQNAAELYATVQELGGNPLGRPRCLREKVARNLTQLSRLRFPGFGAK